MLRLSLISYYTLVLCSICCGQQVDFSFDLESQFFDHERKIYVHLPEYYHDNPTDSLGVVFVLDAQAESFYQNAKGIVDYLVWSHEIMPLIVVGVHSQNRGTEFIPKDDRLDEDHEDNSGQADKLRAHIRDDIIPLLEDSFRINGFRALVGHSRGGAFVANTLFGKSRDLFDAYIAISPGMHYLDNQILDQATTALQSRDDFHKFYYCSYGTVGELEKYFKPQVDLLDSLIRVHDVQSIEWRKKVLEGKSHWSQVAMSLADGLVEMSRAYLVDQYLVEKWVSEGKDIATTIETYEATQRDKLNYYIPVSSSFLRYFGTQYFELEDYQSAEKILKVAVQRDPQHWRSYSSLAYAQHMGDNSEAALDTINLAREQLLSSNLSEDEKLKWQGKFDNVLKELGLDK